MLLGYVNWLLRVNMPSSLYYGNPEKKANIIIGVMPFIYGIILPFDTHTYIYCIFDVFSKHNLTWFHLRVIGISSIKITFLASTPQSPKILNNLGQ